MEDINIEDDKEKIPINATQIIAKYRSIKDRINFCFEKNWYHPREIGFDANYFLKVIMGEKKYLPNNFTVNYKMHYFRKGEKLDKDYIIQKMKKSPAYAEYTPDVKDPKKFSKEFLLLLVAYIDPNLYRELYAVNKQQLSERFFNKWGDYKIDVKKDLIRDIEQFTSVSSQKNSRGGFRTTKNHLPTGTFYKFRNINNEQNLNQNNNMYLNQKIEQLERVNQESRVKNDQLMMENNNLLQKIQQMEKEMQKNGIKEDEEMDQAKRQMQKTGYTGKTMKIKIMESINKNKK